MLNNDKSHLELDPKYQGLIFGSIVQYVLKANNLMKSVVPQTKLSKISPSFSLPKFQSSSIEILIFQWKEATVLDSTTYECLVVWNV